MDWIRYNIAAIYDIAAIDDLEPEKLQLREFMNSEVPPIPPNELPSSDSGQTPSISAEPSSNQGSVTEAPEVVRESVEETDFVSQLDQPAPVSEPTVGESLSHSPSRRGWHRPWLAMIILGVLSYSFLLPMAIHSLDSDDPSVMRRQEKMPLSQMIEVHSMKAFAVLWIVSLGATVGSFLNVVAYRMPRNKSVVFNASRCPKCNSNIRPTDNVPIFGWLRLEGRCRNCGNSISSQYPIVEALTAAIFLLLFSVELVSGGANLPLRTPNFYSGIVFVLFELRWDLILYFLYHSFLFCLVLSWTLIDLDRQKVTNLAILVSSLLIVAPLIVHPYLQPVPAIVSANSYPLALPQALLSSLIGGLFGLAIGAMFAWIYFCKPLRNHDQPEETSTEGESLETKSGSDIVAEDHCSVPSARNIVSLMLLIGLGLGWQAVWTVGLAALCLRLICYFAMQAANYRLPLSVFVLVGLTVHQVGWRWIFKLLVPCWFGDSFSAIALVILVVASAALLLLNRFSIAPARTVEV